MTERERTEQDIRDILVNENSAIAFSNCLFSPTGLFNQLARTQEERREVAKSSLFKQAQKRLSELQREEAAEFVRALPKALKNLPETGYLFKLEKAENP